MVISDEKRFVFIHNPKVAGSSIRRALLRFDGRNDFYWMFHDSAALGRLLDKAHMPLADFRTEFPKDAALLADYFVFMFARNPYDRAVSAYNELANRKLLVTMSPRRVGDYVRELNKFITETCTERTIRNELVLRHFIPQTEMCGFGEQCVAHYVGKFEDFKSSLSAITNLAKLPANTFRKLERLNTRNSGFRALDLLSRGSVTRINLLYERDFEQFGYRTESPDRAGGDLSPGSRLLKVIRRRLSFSG